MIINTTEEKYVCFIIEINNLEYAFQIFIQILIQNLPNHPLKLIKVLIGYAQQVISLIDYQTDFYRINEITEIMDAFIAIYLTYGRSGALKNLYCLKLSKAAMQLDHRFLNQIDHIYHKRKVCFFIMDINKLKYSFQLLIEILIQNLPNYPLTLFIVLIGYAQQGISLFDYQTNFYRINEIAQVMDAYIANYLTYGTSGTLKKLQCLSLSKQQEQE